MTDPLLFALLRERYGHRQLDTLAPVIHVGRVDWHTAFGEERKPPSWDDSPQAIAERVAAWDTNTGGTQ